MKDSPSRLSLFRIAVFAVLLLGLAAGVAPAQKSDSVVKVAAKLSKSDTEGDQTVTITVDVDKPYHLYANPVGNPALKAAQTTVRFSTKLAEEPKIEYPEGKLVKDDTVGNYKTYEGTLKITAKVRRVKGDSSPLNLSIKLQACDKNSCLLPATVKLTAE